MFEARFRETKGQPIEFDGQMIQMFDRVPVRDGQAIRIVFESSAPDRRQGISLTVDGSVEVNGQVIKKGIVLWVDTAPPQITLTLNTRKGECLIKNVWDRGDGVMDSWHGGAAMMVEDIGSLRRYQCNDGRENTDFTDLIFTLERLA